MRQTEKSCGAVIYYVSDEERLYLLIQNLRGGHWGFPKGHTEAGESERETALREIQEETGLNVQLDPSFRERIAYSIPKGQKEVVYFLAQTSQKQIAKQVEEVAAYTFLPYEAALQRITHTSDRSVLEKAHHSLSMNAPGNPI